MTTIYDQLDKRAIYYCKKTNILDFLKCNKNCKITVVENGSNSPKGCIYGFNIPQNWERETNNVIGNLSCSLCSSKNRRMFNYGKIGPNYIYLWVCYNCGTSGYAIKDPFSKGSMNVQKVPRFLKLYNALDILELIKNMEKV